MTNIFLLSTEELNNLSKKELIQLIEDNKSQEVSTRDVIRHLLSTEEGMTASEVKDVLKSDYNRTIRDSEIYGLVSKEPELNLIKSDRSENSKKAQVIQMLEDGKTNTEISKELNTHYSYVTSIKSQWMKSQKTTES